MMLDWTAYPAELNARVKELSRLAPNAVAGFIALDNGASKTTHLDAKTRELIALAVAVTTRCDGCIGVHTDRAIKAGATREEVARRSAWPLRSMPARPWPIRRACSMPMQRSTAG